MWDKPCISCSAESFSDASGIVERNFLSGSKSADKLNRISGVFDSWFGSESVYVRKALNDLLRYLRDGSNLWNISNYLAKNSFQQHRLVVMLRALHE